MMDVVSPDDPWLERCAYFVQRFFKTRTRKFVAAIVILTMVFTIFVMASTFFNWFFDLDGTPLDIEKSAHFTLQPTDARAYDWLLHINAATGVERVGNLTGVVASSVIAARSALKNARELILVHDSYCDKENSSDVDCYDAAAFPTTRMTQRQAYYKRVQLQAYRFLSNNFKQKPCVCGPQLGYSIRYIGVYAGSKRKAQAIDSHNNNNLPLDSNNAVDNASPTSSEETNDKDRGDMNDYVRFVAAIDADRQADAVVVHMFNPIDEQATIYDALDANQMKEQNIGLGFSSETQNYRYNTSRGDFNLLRRTRVRVAYQNEHCQWQRPWITGASALCVQECFDLLRGIDIRERARMQYKSGVVLNRNYFSNDGQAERESCRRPELQMKMLNRDGIMLHDEL